MYDAIIFTDITDNIVNAIPIGAYKCAHVIRKQGYSCLVVNHLSDYTLSELYELLEISIGKNTKLVGFSTTFLKSTEIEIIPGQPTPPYPDLLPNVLFPQGKEFENQVIQYIKNKNNSIKILAGGAKVNPNYSNKNVDYVCLGYSEISIVNLMNHLVKNDTLLYTTTNIWGRKIIDDKFAKDYNFPNEDMEWLDIDVVNHKVLPIEIGRGCIFKCKFCSYPMNGKQQLDFIKSANLLYTELQTNYDKFGIKDYIVVDDTFNDHPDKLHLILSAIERLNFQPIFWAYHRLDLLATRPETLDILYKIGVRSMYFGIETFNSKTGRIIGKGYNRTKQVNVIKRIREHYKDIDVHGSFIIGLPEESIEDVTRTYKNLCDQTIPLHSWQFLGLKIFKTTVHSFNSEFNNNFSQYGYVDQGSGDSNAIHWKNNFMDFAKAQSLANQFMSNSRTLDHFHISGQLTTQLLNLGYTKDELSSTNFKSFDWHKCETISRPTFIKQYKSQLVDLLKSKI